MLDISRIKDSNNVFISATLTAHGVPRAAAALVETQEPVWSSNLCVAQDL